MDTKQEPFYNPQNMERQEHESIDEQRIIDAWKRSEHERRYTHEELIAELRD